MQLAFAALGKLFGGLGLGGAATAGAAATTAATTAAGSGFGALQALGTAVKILGTLGSGLAAASFSRAQADQADLQAGQEQIKSVQRQTTMASELKRVLGENDVAFASAGIDLSGGIAQSSAAAAKKKAARELSIERSDSEFNRALLRLRASGLRSRANSEIGGALIGAVGTGIDYGISVANRGDYSVSLARRG